jgi:glutamate N-acetyltransferase/amino-acid N-acetyltransferase
MGKSAVEASPFAPQQLPDLPVIEGVRLAACQAGIRYANRTDLLMAVLDPGTVAAGVLTQSKTSSAPVLWCRQSLKKGMARALVVNSGNANAFTGKKGAEATRMTAEAAARAVGAAPEDVYVSSTGVIGEPLDASKFAHLLGDLAGKAAPDAWHDAARAIMTTDTFPKLATRTVKLKGGDVAINGIAKGAGMIAPDLATMLVYIFTDAAVERGVLQGMLSSGADTTFNCITIDSDTSTSDTVLAFATGKAAARGVSAIRDAKSAEGAAFAAALHDLMRELALWVVKDGEGLTKFVTINVKGAESDAAARRIGFSIANSPLVKTAIAGSDPNWGRVVMAVGKAGEAADRDRLSIWYGDIQVARDGERAPTYDEPTVAAYMAGEATVWTCDLTHGYISVNADYRS